MLLSLQMKILLIEDDPKVARIVATGLESERYTVQIAANGPDGLHAELSMNSTLRL